MWAPGLFAIAAAGATGLRYYVDRRVGQLNEIARAEQEQKRIAAQAEGEANLRAQLQVTEEKLKDSGRKLSGLEERAQPRVFTASQRDRLLSFLKGKPSGRLVIKASITSPDARAYAEAIRDALAAGGWTVRIDNAMFAGSNTLGLWITVNNPATAPTAAGILQNALKTAGIEARGQYDTTRNVDDDELWLSVGNR